MSKAELFMIFTYYLGLFAGGFIGWELRKSRTYNHSRKSDTNKKQEYIIVDIETIDSVTWGHFKKINPTNDE